MPRVLDRRDAAIWAGAFLLVASLLVFTRFTSDDPDSALYAALSARLADGPPSHWIAPEWWGLWESEGLFREHPVGVLLVPTVLGFLGLPAVQAAYIVGLACALLSVVLMGFLIARLTTPAEGRLAIVLLQVMPVAFIFRIRANHEYPMLLCLLVLLIGLDKVRSSWWWLPVPALALTAALLVKGVFVIIPVTAAAIWLALNPTGAHGSVRRPLAACALAAGVMVSVVVAYDARYLAVTGEPFWGPYWERQLAPLTISTPLGAESTIGDHVQFYLLRLVWHPAPWSFALLAGLWRLRHAPAAQWRALPVPTRRGLLFVLLFAGASIVLLSPASRFAERYSFSANYAIAAAGVVAALRVWPGLRVRIVAADRAVPALPAWCWLVLMLLRLTVGPLLPRITS